MTRAAVYGWGLVAPGAANIDEFQQKLDEGGSWLERFDGFGPDSFLVGKPKFNFADWRRLSKTWAPERTFTWEMLWAPTPHSTPRLSIYTEHSDDGIDSGATESATLLCATI
jgi:hypothetical protein